MMKTMRCIAIDDEPIALMVIARFCQRHGGIDLQTFSEPALGLDAVAKEKPDVVFLDIEMNDVNGLDIANSLPAECNLIFTTAHAKYAINGFDLDAVDFLHKPFSYERFEKSIEKAIRNISMTGHADSHKEESIIIKKDYNNVIIKTADIVYVEAMENYIKIYMEDGSCVISHTSLKNFIDKPQQPKLMRIHRSFAINMSKVISFNKKEVMLKGQLHPVPIGRLYSSKVYSALSANKKG